MGEGELRETRVGDHKGRVRSGTHFLTSSLGKRWKSVWYVILDIDQRIRPTVVQTGANVTLEDCEDTLHQVVGKAQQLFAYTLSDKNSAKQVISIVCDDGYLGYSLREVGEDTV